MSGASPSLREELARYEEMLAPLAGIPPTGPSTLPHEEVQAWEQAVRTLRGYHGDHLELEEAVAAFARALWTAPGWAEPPARIAEALAVRARRWPEPQRSEALALARRFADRAFGMDVACVPARAAVARLHLLAGSLDEADRIALPLPTEQAPSLALRAELAEARGRIDDAIRLRTDQIAAETEAAPARDARNRLGLLLQSAGKIEDAIRTHRDNLSRHPDYSWGRVNLASALEAAGQVVEAHAEVATAVDLGLEEARPYLDELAAHIDRRALDEFRAALRSSRDGDPLDLCPAGGA